MAPDVRGFRGPLRLHALGPLAKAFRPYRPQTKGKTESGVKYVQRNALAGRRFASWAQLNAWLLEWAVTVGDQCLLGTTHEPQGYIGGPLGPGDAHPAAA